MCMSCVAVINIVVYAYTILELYYYYMYIIYLNCYIHDIMSDRTDLLRLDAQRAMSHERSLPLAFFGSRQSVLAVF